MIHFLHFGHKNFPQNIGFLSWEKGNVPVLRRKCCKGTDSLMDTWTDWQTGTQTDGKMDRQTGREFIRPSDRAGGPIISKLNIIKLISEIKHYQC